MDKPVTLVTGVSRGIGLAIAQHMTALGHHVVGIARTHPVEFEGTFVAVDFDDLTTAGATLKEIAADYRPLRVVNNAGAVAVAAIEDATVEQFEWMVRINLQAPMLVMQTVIPVMRAANFGRIVNIGSRAAQGKPGRSIYGATKGGLYAMTRTVALETAEDGITANLIAPGPIETDMIRESCPPGSEARAKLTGGVPMARFGQPEEIAAATAYFLSDAAGFTTGQALNVCGGMTVGSASL